MSNDPSQLNTLFQQQLTLAQARDEQLQLLHQSGPLLEVPPTGRIVSSAYEQLRNAAEYAEEHLLLERAIKRFFKRNLLVAKRQQHDLGSELIIDLAQAGYLQGSQFSKATAEQLNQLITQYVAVHGRLRQAHLARETADDWVLALLSTNAENLLNPHHLQRSTLVLAYQYFVRSIPRATLTDQGAAADYELCLYIAVHQAILKSDIDIIRHDIHELYQQPLDDTAGFISLSRRVDELSASQLTHSLKRLVSRSGAPFRVLRSLTDSRPDVDTLLGTANRFLEAYDRQIDEEYRQLDKRLARGLIKSIVFLIITKLLIGVAVEIPYDLLMHGSVIVLPLAVNLLFPPLYLTGLMLNLHLPGAANKQSLHAAINQLLYSEQPVEIRPPKRRRATARSRLAYAVLFAVPLIVTVLILQRLGFNIVQMAIFFVFFSTASFLGFRLSTLVRDLELTRRQTGLLASLQDFFYLPFVTLGQWLSRKYSRLNLVARFMDIAIELPLKSLLRLIQQWMSFVRERHEELY